MKKSPDVVLLSTADWDNPFWTNKQHVAVELARRGFRVLYLESLGLRRPSLKSRDLRRILRRLWKLPQPPRRVHENLWVWSPIALPAYGRPSIRLLNRWLLLAGLAIWVRWLRMRRDVVWTYNPLSAELLDLSWFRTVVYHCVDEIKASPGVPREVIGRAETQLVRRANVVFATSRKLAESRIRHNPNTYYLSNVADYDHFAKARDPATRVPEDLTRISGPRIGFVGAISGYKLDFALLRQLAESHPEWSVVLIGQVGEGDPWTDISELMGLRNLHLLGPRPYSLIPAYMKGFRVGLLPNQLNDYTTCMFPMKFFEYLAAGLPVVSVDLPALRDHADVATLVRTPQAFIEAVESELANNGPSIESRIARARQYTYASRMDTMLRILEHIDGRLNVTRADRHYDPGTSE